ncbi:squalene/phytoene synthase family protein [Paracoccus saliphilus]|uniref:Squalene/phytoene synthase n=1 Tax=Paracoccus saliphilus TaxID=405559 RepID=A0AA46A5S1_9RHOB|nr:squalene/phytoene synthase family protein [Paracoccus saliphilus]WCR04134.1 squalene/phytoene synthase family protein [Paracoccus saliphilus]SIS85438.1 Squalene/phytoene synthase [Paracoccus saliphilus]
MTLEACTETLREHDPGRFGAVLTAAPEHRPALVTLYALNLEIARAPFQSAEPMLAEMRLQWWIDRLAEMGDGTAPPLHDVLTPLWDAWGTRAGDLAALAEARRRDCERQAFSSPAQVVSYVETTAGELMWQAASALGVPVEAREAVADQALGVGLAAWLRALPQLQPMGLGLADAQAEHAQELAGIGREALRRAARGRRAVPKSVAAALYPGPRVVSFLAEIAEGKVNCFSQQIEITPFQRRASLAWLALTGRWWR